MQAPVRICSLLLLFSAAVQDFAQPATNGPATTPNMEPVVRRRFQRATNQALATTNTAATSALPAPIAPAVQTPPQSLPAFPQVPSIETLRSNAAAARAAARAATNPPGTTGQPVTGQVAPAAEKFSVQSKFQFTTCAPVRLGKFGGDTSLNIGFPSSVAFRIASL